MKIYNVTASGDIQRQIWSMSVKFQTIVYRIDLQFHRICFETVYDITFHLSSTSFLVVICVLYISLWIYNLVNTHTHKKWIYVISDIVNALCFVTFLSIVTFSQVYMQIKQGFYLMSVIYFLNY